MRVLSARGVVAALTSVQAACDANGNNCQRAINRFQSSGSTDCAKAMTVTVTPSTETREGRISSMSSVEKGAFILAQAQFSVL